MRDFLVSVLFITYNHEAYIRKALDSVLSQETDFPFEIVVGEDCSTDGTRDILRQYKEKYPDKFRLLFRKKNFGRPTRNVYETWKACKGRYVAFLEGDDYWCDVHKLQKQIDFLENNPYIGVTHSCKLVGKNGERVDYKAGASLYEWSGEFTFEDYKYSGKWPGQTATVVCHNLFLNPKYDYSILYKAHDFLDDGVILLFLLIQGKVYRMDQVMSAWRFIQKEGEGNWNSLKLRRNAMVEDCYTKQKLLKWCEKNVGLSEYGRELAKKDFVTALSVFLKKPTKKHWKFVKDMYSYNIKNLVQKGRKTSFFFYCIKTLGKEGWKLLSKLLTGRFSKGELRTTGTKAREKS